MCAHSDSNIDWTGATHHSQRHTKIPTSHQQRHRYIFRRLLLCTHNIFSLYSSTLHISSSLHIAHITCWCLQILIRTSIGLELGMDILRTTPSVAQAIYFRETSERLYSSTKHISSSVHIAHITCWCLQILIRTSIGLELGIHSDTPTNHHQRHHPLFRRLLLCTHNIFSLYSSTLHISSSFHIAHITCFCLSKTFLLLKQYEGKYSTALQRDHLWVWTVDRQLADLPIRTLAVFHSIIIHHELQR